MLLQHLTNRVSKFDTEDEGQGLVEYGLILVLVSVVAIATLRVVGTSIVSIYTAISGALLAA